MNNSVNLTSQRISFVNKISILQKALSDDETPTPGYLYKEINDISFESIGYSESLVEFIVDRLQHHNSCNVKLKVLKLMKHIAEHGSQEFQLGLRHRVSIIKEHTKFSGPPHPVHGNSPYSMVRNLAVELCERLYNMNTLTLNTSKQREEGMHSQQQQKYSGIGSSSCSGGAIQGFGNSPPASHSKGIAGTILQEIEKLGTRLSIETPADRQAAVLARLNLSASSSNYQPPVVIPETPDAITPLSPNEELVESVQQRPSIKPITHHPGKAGGGWNDDDDDDDEEDANNDNGGVDGNTDGCQRVDAVIGSGEGIGSNDQEKDGIQPRHNEDMLESKEGENLLVEDSQEKRLVEDCLSGALPSSSSSSSWCSDQSPGYLSNSDISLFIQACSKLRCGLVLDCICHCLGQKDAALAAKSLQLLEAFVYSRTQLVSLDRLAARCKPVLVDCFNNAAIQATASQGGDNNDDDETMIDRNSRNCWIVVQTKTAKLILILQQLSSHKDILPSSYISQELAVMASSPPPPSHHQHQLQQR